MLKGTGLLLLALSCTLCGVENAWQYVRHTRCLAEMQAFTHALYMLLCYDQLSTQAMLQKALASCPQTVFRPEGKSIESLLHSVKALPVTAAEKELFSNVLHRLGTETRDAQEELLRGAEVQLAAFLAAAKEAEAQNKKLCITFGVCTGLVLALLLM